MSLSGEEDPRRGEPEGTSPGRDPTRAERGRGRPSRTSPLLVLLAVLVLALVVLAALLLWRSLGESVPGTSVAKDSIDSDGPEPQVRLTNASGRVSVEGVEDSRSVEYEATRYAMAADPAAAKQRASEVPVDISREDSKIVIETDGGDDTGADYTLRIPAGGSVEVESEAGDVEVSGLTGNVTVDAEAGDVTVRDVGGGVRVESPQGDVTVANVNTDTGGAELEVGSGDVSLEDLILGTLEAGVEAGSVTLSGRFSGGGRVSVETGDIVARLPAEDTRDLTLQTRVGSVLREPPSGDSNDQDSEKQDQGS